MEVLGGGNDLIVKIKVPLLGKYQTMASSNATLGVGWWYMGTATVLMGAHY